MPHSQAELTIDQVIGSWLPAIDAELHGTPIPDRCMPAAFIFMERIVLEVRGDDKADFFTKPWFKPIYQSIVAWYRKHYGAAFDRRPNDLRGACDFLGAIFELRVPRTLSRVETEDETAWLIFPEGLWESELSSDWIARPPNLALLDVKDRDSLLQDVTIVGCQLRTIFVNLMERNSDEVMHELIRMVLPHLSGAAASLVEQPAHNLGLACWDAHQAVEKILKALSRQQFGNHRHTHNIKRLRDDVARSGLALPDDALLNCIPNDRRIVAIRSGESRVGCPEAYQIYRSCLEATAICAAAITRKYPFHDFQLLLRKPSFI
jgi:HEPN domain-containing protein